MAIQSGAVRYSSVELTSDNKEESLMRLASSYQLLPPKQEEATIKAAHLGREIDRSYIHLSLGVPSVLQYIFNYSALSTSSFLPSFGREVFVLCLVAWQGVWFSRVVAKGQTYCVR